MIFPGSNDGWGKVFLFFHEGKKAGIFPALAFALDMLHEVKDSQWLCVWEVVFCCCRRHHHSYIRWSNRYKSVSISTPSQLRRQTWLLNYTHVQWSNGVFTRILPAVGKRIFFPLFNLSPPKQQKQGTGCKKAKYLLIERTRDTCEITHTIGSHVFLPENRHRSGGNFQILLLCMTLKGNTRREQIISLVSHLSLFLSFHSIIWFPGDQKATIAVASFFSFFSSETGIVWNAFHALLTKIKSAILFPGSKDTCFSISPLSQVYRYIAGNRTVVVSLSQYWNKNVKV